MNICIPIEENLGLKSRICLHFGKALRFVVVDPDTMMFEVFDYSDTERMDMRIICRLLSAHHVSGVVVGGIGLAALEELQSEDIAVYSSTADTVEEIVLAFNAGTVNPVTLGVQCHRTSGRSFSIPTCGRGVRGRGGDCSGGC